MTDPYLVTAILGLGLVLKLAGFAARDELVLRALVTGGLVCDATFYAVRAEPVLQSVAANAALVAVNAVLIVLIVTERMSASDRALFARFPTLTPGQFRRLRKAMRWQETAPGHVLMQEGAPVADLALVLAERIEITKQDRSFPVAGPAFVGEIALLTGHPSSARVSLPEDGSVVAIPIPELRARMARSPAVGNAMVALFGRELARKVADSVPMARAAAPRPDAGGGEARPDRYGAASAAADVVGQVRSGAARG